MKALTNPGPGAVFALAAAAALALGGCTSAAPQQAGEPATAGQGVTVMDTWVKAAETGMTGVFGEVANAGGSEITVVSVTSPAAASAELHETVDDGTGTTAMREKDGGFTVPVGGTLTLEPGGDHIMLMDLTAPILPGDEIELTLGFSDGSQYAFTAPAKDYSGANENYVGDDMDMGGEG